MRTRGLAVLILAQVCAAFVAANAAASELSAIIWRAPGHPFTTSGYEAWAAKIAERSKGALTIRVNPAKFKFTPQAHLKALRDGAVDIAHHAAAFTQDELPELALLSAIAPGLDDPLASALAITEFAMRDELMQSRFKALGIVFGGGYALPSQVLVCGKPVTTLAAMRGAKMRFANPVRRQWATSLGAAAVALPLADVVEAMRQGLVDCVAGDGLTFAANGLLTPGLTIVGLDVGLELSGWQYALNRASWRKLTPPMRRLLLDTMAEQVPVAVSANGEAVLRAEREALAAGIKRVVPEAALKASFDAFVAANSRQRAAEIARGRLDQSAVDGLLDRFQATRLRWGRLLAAVDRNDTAAVGALLRREVYDRLDEQVYGIN